MVNNYSLDRKLWTDRHFELYDNRREVLENIQEAYEKSGRKDALPTLLAVTKYHPWEDVIRLAEIGQRQFAESRAQEYMAKREAIDSYLATQEDAFAQEKAFDQENAFGQEEATNLKTIFHKNAAWHMIGTLQKNKIKYLLPSISLIHSVDSFSLAEAIHKKAKAIGHRQDILLQVNSSLETQKHGFSFDSIKEAFLPLIELDGIRIRGLMTMAMLSDDTYAIEKCFSSTQELFYQLKKEIDTKAEENFSELSMGMSQDYPIAVRYGATILRVGSAILKSRTE